MCVSVVSMALHGISPILERLEERGYLKKVGYDGDNHYYHIFPESE